VQLNHAGAQALAQGDLESAEARLALALEYHPRFVDALVNLGLVALQQGNFVLARKRLERARSINRHLAQPHHGLGLVAEREQRWSDAATHYRSALEVDPGFGPSRANLARLCFAAQRYDDAREQFLRLTQVQPSLIHGWVGLIESLYRLGRQPQGDEVLRRASAHLGDRAELRIYHGRLALRQGRLRQAHRLLASVVDEAGPSAREAWSWLGLTYLARGRTNDAAACSEQALVHDPDDALATYVLAMALVHRGDPDAPAWLRRARKLAPNNSVVTATLADLRPPAATP
jgi:tetratricopeptide (TPR) repeat protein